MGGGGRQVAWCHVVWILSSVVLVAQEAPPSLGGDLLDTSLLWSAMGRVFTGSPGWGISLYPGSSEGYVLTGSPADTLLTGSHHAGTSLFPGTFFLRDISLHQSIK